MQKTIRWLVSLLVTLPTVLWGESLQVTVDLRFQDERESVREATLRARPFSEKATPEKTFEVRVPGSLEIALEAKTIWRFELEGDGLWSPGATIYTAPDLETVTIDAYAASRLTGKLEVEEGEDEPEELQVRFQPSEKRGGGPAEKTVPCTVESSRFACILPRAGAWRIDVRAKSPDVSRNLEKVEVPEPPHGEPVFVELDLPNTTLSGRVIDPSGRPLPKKSVVTALSIEKGLDSMVQQQTDDGSTFEFQGLEPGIYRLTAEALLDGRRASSEPTSVILSAERETERVELVVRAMDEIRGVVESSDGPIPGAIVRIRPLTGGRSLTQLWPEGLTNRQGRFALQVPAASDRLEILVGAAGHELKLFSVLSPFDQPLHLQVEKLGGSLLLDLGREATLFPMVFQDGKAVGGPPGLLRWASSNGEPNHDPSRILVPLMAPGEYLVCLLEPAERNAMVWNLMTPNPQACRGGYLQPHGRLEIDLKPGAEEAKD